MAGFGLRGDGDLDLFFGKLALIWCSVCDRFASFLGTNYVVMLRVFSCQSR